MHRISRLCTVAQNINVWYIVTACCIVYCACFGSIRWSNTVRLYTLTRAVFTYPVPPETEMAHQEAHIGALTGLHDHCDYVVRQAFRTHVSETVIKQFYAHASETVIKQFYAHASVPSLVGKGKRIPLDVRITHAQQANEPLEYTIEAFDGNYPNTFELRCS